MSLHYLSGDEMAGKRKEKRKKKKEERKEKRKDKKGKGKGKGKGRVVKFALLPVRGAFITLVTLNLFKLGTKLAKVWNKSGGKEKLTDMWVGKFKGDLSKLKTAISKGSKTSISGDDDEIGGVTPAVMMATAFPVILALIPILGAYLDKKEMSDLEGGVASGKEELNKNPDDYDKDENGDDDDKPTFGSFFSAFGMCIMGIFQLMFIEKQYSITNPILLLIFAILETYFFFGLFFGFIYQAEFKAKKYIAWYFDVPKNFFIKLFSYGKKIC